MSKGFRFRYWLPVSVAADLIGVGADSIYRDLRLKRFPFRTEIIGGRIHISARDIGLTPPTDEPQKSEAQTQGENFQEAA